ncbi:ribosomal RNA small subunit methyltransferase A [Candidatus Peribacteria bacterium RIFCSPHIGHO2_02_FULL_49_16]|nr:MAG: ribosomal RNA small subunit methyltransferase A [Candidatus Peribacteria bacterium RIFCSPHIGHO2_01_FULL_49_38]OGJ58782.1 MAG: ribosomal RNA small subunit methyltransferase A [Candidatus Peribacteria bacterium RIFCSPHIGHO2_02_FULL_49_16]
MLLEQEIRNFCKKHGIQLNKDYGQHFLITENILENIIKAANIQPHDHIVEIGPGIGTLTRELLKCTSHITAIEIDTCLTRLLQEFLVTSNAKNITNNLNIINNNALHTPFPAIPYKIVANIPYHITSPLLRHTFLESACTPTSLTLMIQKEVAEKICDEKNRGLLTILVSLFGKPHIICTVPRCAFLPPPKVHSAVLQIDCFSKPIVDKPTLEKIFILVKHAFSQKRKMLRNTIGSLPDGLDMLQKAGIDPERRPQTVSTEEWIRLAKVVSS